jgi:hypothetical protein
MFKKVIDITIYSYQTNMKFKKKMGYSKVIALSGQLSAASLQSQLLQEFSSITYDFPSSPNSKTFGQITSQVPHPVQRK